MMNQDTIRDLLRQWHMAEEVGQWRLADQLLEQIEKETKR